MESESMTHTITCSSFPASMLMCARIFPPHCLRVLSRNGDPHVEFLEKGQVLRVKSVRPRDRGLYQCVASNNAGTQTRQFRLNVQGKW